jgi:hypothetical protein
MTASLYEGASCWTTDLDERWRFTFIVPPSCGYPLDFRLRNADEGGDYVDFRLNVYNSTWLPWI